MIPRTKTKLLAFMLLISYAYSFEFKNAEEDGVVFVASTGVTQNVDVDENNNPTEFKIVKIVNVKSTLAYQIQSGDKALNPSLEKIDDESYYLKGLRLDYEAINPKSILLSISEDGDSNSQRFLNVRIQNLEDEPPILTVTQCQMEENNLYDVDTTPCIFTIADPDGWLDYITFDIIGNSGEDEIFDLVYAEPPDNYTYSADLFLVLQKELDYENVTLYSFVVQAEDSAHNPTSPPNISVIVEVIDMPDMPPVWTYFPYAARITEKTPTTLSVSARDGDYGINNEINYRISMDPENGDIADFNITIGIETGLIEISYIDRDSGHDQVIFEVTAYEKVDELSTLTDSITLLVTDIDDNVAIITASTNDLEDVRPNGCDNLTQIDIDEKSVVISICERATDIVNLDISANDIDLGENATYTVALQSRSDFDFSEGLQIIPGRGYEQSTLTLSIANSNLLDYEDDDWKTIELNLHTQGTKTPSNIDDLPITINLIDWNDESPIFSQSEYTVAFREDIAIDTTIIIIQATDRDAEDIEKGLKHEIVGVYANTIVKIPDLGGNITTTLDKSFDHEKQDEVYIQIRAKDAVGHTATALLTVTVIDVNDKDPRLVVSSVVEIEENQEDGTVLDVTISASDEDTTADLLFDIDWTLSYATKNSMRLTDDQFAPYLYCIGIQTTPGETNHIAYATLSINETVKDNTPDFEIFDTLFIMLVVEDLCTEIGNGTDSSYVVINVIDVNDNPPDLSSNEDKTWRVTENSPDGTLIGSITYYDPDTVGEVTLSIAPNNEDTPKWVTINPSTGALTVKIEEFTELDCDDPVRYDLKYNITADDTVFQTSIEISISITDENENIPEVGDVSVSIDEDFGDGKESDGSTVKVLTDIKDIDRDDPNHTVRCALQSGDAEVTNRFTIVNDTVIVVALQGGANLDREKQASYTFQLNCFDDPNKTGPRSNTASPPPTITVTLDDVNDNTPTIPITSGYKFNEIDKKGATLQIKGEDADEGKNGMINFTLKSYKRYLDQTHETEAEENPDDLFTVKTEDTHKSAVLSVAAENLNNYFGYYLLTIETRDQGDPYLLQDNIIELEVTPYNFKEIQFVFPEDGKTYYIAPKQDSGLAVKLYNNNDYLSNLNANDNGQNKYKITYTVFDDGNRFTTNGVSITIKAPLPSFNENDVYPVTVQAKLDTVASLQSGEAPHEKNCTIKFQVFSQENAEPTFETQSDSVKWPENNGSFEYQLPPISYPEVDLPDLPKYYLLAVGDRDIFNLDNITGLLTLRQEFDYEKITSYDLVIQASRTTTLNQDASDDTKFKLNIEVLDVNDNPPVFDQKQYYGTVVTNTQANTVILTVSATDVDTTSKDQLRYSIDSFTGSNDDLQKLSEPFQIDSVTGIITSKIVITDSLKGFFDLALRVMDEAPEYHNDTASAQIYIVSADNTVNFKFQNDLEDIRNRTSTITEILDKKFQMLSHVHNPSRADDDTTLTPIYFINKNVPVEASEILGKVTDTKEFQELSALFKAQQLYLVNFQTTSDSNKNMSEIFKAWLIGVCVVLGALCLILSVAFILKTRSLNQRITKLSNTKFGSQESGLNRTGVAAPTTNKHALEGSNPVYNNEVSPKDLDQASVTSGDSDLIGVEDDEKFDYDYPTKDEVIS